MAMNFLLFIEGVLFSCFYSTAPFLAFDVLYLPVYGEPLLEPAARREFRYFVVSCLAFVLFNMYYAMGCRTRYVLWHIDRRRYGSGFTPVETCAVAVYHSVLLCLTTETLLPALDGFSPRLLSEPWALQTGIRMKNIFLLSILQHTFLELSGFFDKVRREYFDVDRD